MCKSYSNHLKSRLENETSINKTLRLGPGGPLHIPPMNCGASHNIHAYTAPQSESKTNNIKLSHGYADVWSGIHDQMNALHKFLQLMKLLSMVRKGILEVVAPEIFHISDKLFKNLLKNNAYKRQKECFGFRHLGELYSIPLLMFIRI